MFKNSTCQCSKMSLFVKFKQCDIFVQARGKSGPLFSFDVRDDIRLVNDASVEKEESHAGPANIFYRLSYTSAR